MTGYSYDVVGNKVSNTYPDGSVVKYGHDALNRLTSVTDAENEITTYNYDPVGRPIEILYPNGIMEQKKYDPVGQLVEILRNGQQQSVYTYDPAGNLMSDSSTSESTMAVIIENIYNALNQLTVKTVKNELEQITGQFEYTYDKRGNLVKESDVLNSTEKTYLYDATNKMGCITNSGVDNKSNCCSHSAEISVSL